MASTLTDEQKRNLNSYIAPFKDWLSTSDGSESVAEHRNHERFFARAISSSFHMKSWLDSLKSLWPFMNSREIGWRITIPCHA